MQVYNVYASVYVDDKHDIPDSLEKVLLRPQHVLSILHETKTESFMFDGITPALTICTDGAVLIIGVVEKAGKVSTFVECSRTELLKDQYGEAFHSYCLEMSSRVKENMKQIRERYVPESFQ